MNTLTSLLLVSTVVFAKHPKMARDLDQVDGSSTVDVIVRFHQPPGVAQHQKVRDRGGVYKAALPLVKGALYAIPAVRLEELADDPEVVCISPDRRVTSFTSILPQDYKLQAVGADIAQQSGWNGTGSAWR